MRFEGRTAVITGGAMGFGRAMTVPCDVADEEQVDAAEAAHLDPTKQTQPLWAAVAQRDPADGMQQARRSPGETLKVSGGYPLTF